MNPAYIHLVLCHVPILLMPIGTLILSLGLFKKNETLKITGYWFLILAAVCAVPVFLSGEPSEEIVKLVMGVNEPGIHPHEEMAEIALISTLVTGAFALLGLFSTYKKLFFARQIAYLIILFGVVSSGFLIYTGKLGGQIHHIELNPEVRTAPIMQDFEIEPE